MATDWFFEPTMVDVIELPKTYSLSSAYPNPFNPVTRINFDLPVDSHVSMTVYNLQGRLLTTLSDEIKSAGYHSISWNASQYSSGVYFVSIYAQNTDISTVNSGIKQSFTKTQKLMLVK
jgi:flagellar hook assembly protein FlgD